MIGGIYKVSTDQGKTASPASRTSRYSVTCSRIDDDDDANEELLIFITRE
ncbi:MAG: hypothetical protein R2862_00245 [Thermoanaerobaculia bacterium]